MGIRANRATEEKTNYNIKTRVFSNEHIFLHSYVRIRAFAANKMHFVSVEQTENKLSPSHAVHVGPRIRVLLLFYFRVTPLLWHMAIRKNSFHPKGDVIVMFLHADVAASFPRGSSKPYRISFYRDWIKKA